MKIKLIRVGLLRSLVLMCFVTWTSAQAEDVKSSTVYFGSPHWLLIDKNHTVSVTVQDQVEDGCWTDPKTSENASKLEFTRSGYQVVDESALDSLSVRLTALGFSLNSGLCVLRYDIYATIADNSKYSMDGHEVLGIGEILLYKRSGLMTRQKKTSNQALQELFTAETQALILEIISQRNKMRDKLVENGSSEEGKTYWQNYKW